MFKRKKKNVLSRKQAMHARPQQIKVARTEDQENGSVKIVVHLKRSRWQKWFGAPSEFDRQYLLDPMGREVYEACNGRTPVKIIAKRFAKNHKVSSGEAAMSVAK